MNDILLFFQADFINNLIGNDWGEAALVVFNLIIIESLLSVDNAAVLATMVMDLPKEQRSRALKYGIIGAYVFRGICLVLAAWLVKIWWLKVLGGLYLLWLTVSYFKGKSTPNDPTDDPIDKNSNPLYRYTLGLLGPFWATVALVELMDLAFSIDNVFAAVAFTDKIFLIWVGVFIGILAMRFVAQGFVNLMERFPFLETTAFVVIGILGVKLSASLLTHYYPHTAIGRWLESEHADMLVSIFTVAVFFLPVLSSLLLGYPRRKN